MLRKGGQSLELGRSLPRFVKLRDIGRLSWSGPCESPKPHVIEKPLFFWPSPDCPSSSVFLLLSVCPTRFLAQVMSLCHASVLFQRTHRVPLSFLCSCLDFKDKTFLSCVRKGYFLQKSHCCQLFIVSEVTFPWLCLGCHSSALCWANVRAIHWPALSCPLGCLNTVLSLAVEAFIFFPFGINVDFQTKTWEKDESLMMLR